MNLASIVTANISGDLFSWSSETSIQSFGVLVGGVTLSGGRVFQVSLKLWYLTVNTRLADRVCCDLTVYKAKAMILTSTLPFIGHNNIAV